MASPLTMLDTSFILLLTKPRNNQSAELAERIKNADAAREFLLSKGADIWIPAPVVTELRDIRELEALRPVFGQVQVADYDHRAAEIGALMFSKAIEKRAMAGDDTSTPDRNRTALKFDLMIAAIAHERKATYLVHADEKRRGFTRYLESVGSKVQSLRADRPLTQAGAQLHLLPTPSKQS